MSKTLMHRRNWISRPPYSHKWVLYSLRSAISLVLFLWMGRLLFAQQPISPAKGLRENTPRVFALTNARIITEPGKVIENGTLVIRDGLIVAVGKTVTPPADAEVIDATGKVITPGLIDAYSLYGISEGPRGPQPERKGTAYWSDKVFSATHSGDEFRYDTAKAGDYRAAGFVAALSVPRRGIMKGESALLSLAQAESNRLLLKQRIAQHASLEVDFFARSYPNSLMGVIALIRQTLYDASWHLNVHREPPKGSVPQERPEWIAELDALSRVVTKKQPMVFETTDELSVFRAHALAKEFNLTAWALGNGYEYRRSEEVKKTALQFILPIAFPATPEAASASEADAVGYDEMEHWAMAPYNPKRLRDAGVNFVFTTYGCATMPVFWANVRKAIRYGLSENDALMALTLGPAKLLGVESMLGTLAPGKQASFVLSTGSLFDERTKIISTWIDGKGYHITQDPALDIRGTWELEVTESSLGTLSLEIKGEPSALIGTLTKGGKKTPVTLSLSASRVLMSFAGDSLGLKGVFRLSGIGNDRLLNGNTVLPNERRAVWQARRMALAPTVNDTAAPPEALPELPPLRYPQGEFGIAAPPEQPKLLLIKNATLWTSAKQGKIENGDMLIQSGKISQVGRNLPTPKGAVLIDATGKHITPGLIDCHSHTAISGGVNEVGQAITAEVRVGDVIDSDDINIYRQLAGGLTVANLLHGSANAIGGQNQVIKLRWGSLPEEMKFEGAPAGIKFALGENPKRVNSSGIAGGQRYPFTRQGIEQLIRDEFKAAQEYAKRWNDFRSGKSKLLPRRDLELDAIVEILDKKRLIHSHSYRQDEIIMLLRVAEDFGFKIGTFQHVLEGYKAATELARHGAGASAFSDWWAYKFEVYDAIPYAGAIMHNAGVVVSFNSDSDELARRMNTEAAKAVKYGGVSEEEALKFVTLNPAKQLQIDQRVGSLESGKDADFVVWSGPPLSSYTRCEATWIDGRKYFDRSEDAASRTRLEEHRSQLIQRILSEPKTPAAASGGRPASRRPRHLTIKDLYNCQCHDQTLLEKENGEEN